MQNAPSAEKVVLAIKNDTTSGATELTRDMLVHLSSYAGSLSELTAEQSKIVLLALVKRLKDLRPSMAPLQNILIEWQTQLDELKPISPRAFINQVKRLCNELISDIDTRQNNQIKHAIKVLKDASVILTVSRSSVVSAIFKQLPQRPLRIIVCESRPGCEGRALAKELANIEIAVDYIVDAAMGIFTKQADAIVVGADAILADGSLVNKCGTSLLALAAQRFNVPFYVVADSSKCTQSTSAEFVLEEMPVAELRAPNSPFIHPHNVYFDITPVVDINAYITEFCVEKEWPWLNSKK